MLDFTLSASAKMFLHAAKYPSNSVNGVLLAHMSDKNRIVDAIPLFHVNLGLQPMAEAALYIINHYCLSNSLCIVGYYFAPELQTHFFKTESSKMNILGLKIAEKIAENNGNSCFIAVLSNEQLSSESLTNSFKAFVYSESNHEYTMAKSSIVVCQPSSNGTEASSAVLALLSSKVHNFITDFDDHLSNVVASPDWTNKQIEQIITEIC